MTRRAVRLKAGMRVRVRSTAASPIAGCEGIVTYVGDTMCDVKVVKKKGARVEEAAMDTLPRTELQSVYPNVDLVSHATAEDVGWTRWGLWVLGSTAALVSAWVVVHWVLGA